MFPAQKEIGSELFRQKISLKSFCLKSVTMVSTSHNTEQESKELQKGIELKDKKDILNVGFQNT
jgi:hypothetical protein